MFTQSKIVKIITLIIHLQVNSYTAGHIQQATYSRPHTADHIQQTTYSRPHTVGHIQQTTCRPHTVGHIQQATYSRPHTDHTQQDTKRVFMYKYPVQCLHKVKL